MEIELEHEPVIHIAMTSLPVIYRIRYPAMRVTVLRNSLRGLHGHIAICHVGTVVEQEHEIVVLIVQTSVQATLLKMNSATMELVSFSLPDEFLRPKIFVTL